MYSGKSKEYASHNPLEGERDHKRRKEEKNEEVEDGDRSCSESDDEKPKEARLVPYDSDSEDDKLQVLDSYVETTDADNYVASPSTDQEMTTTSQHSFGGSSESSDAFSITIIENMKEEYGLFVWPCSIVLAEYVWQQRSRFSGASVVELGAGTSLPGLVAAKVGSDVTLTDDSKRLEVMGLTWGKWDASIFELHPKIIIGADVLYDNRAFDDLFATVTFLLQNSPESVFITTYHNRSGHHLIEFLMVKWGLKCVTLLDGYSFMPPCKSAGLSGNIQLAEIVLNS